jgi:hypothetical protein
MRRSVVMAILVLLAGTVLGGTVFRAPVGYAASELLNVFVTNDSTHPVPVREQNTDSNGNIKVHEQGTVGISGVSAVSQSGTWNVGISGTPTVLAQPGIPSTTLTFVKDFTLGTQPILISGPDPTGTTYAISSFVVTNRGTTPAEGDLFAGATSGQCDLFSTFSTQLLRVEVPAGDSRETTMPVPLVLSEPVGQEFECLFAATGGPNMTLSLVAYKVGP